jgi:DNA-binding MarR family transcriptional regulator
MRLHVLQKHKMFSNLMTTPGKIAPVRTTEDPLLVDAWRELLDRHARVTCALEHALEEQHGLGLSEFEVLDRLATAGKDSCRLQELTEAVHLSQSALSRVVARLEAEGLVERAMCKEDRRGVFAALTATGRERHAQARPTHRGVLRDTMPD